MLLQCELKIYNLSPPIDNIFFDLCLQIKLEQKILYCVKSSLRMNLKNRKIGYNINKPLVSEK